MCGIAGIACHFGSTPSAGPDVLVRMRDQLTHRGPDGAGLMLRGNVAMAHRRLAVLDTSSAGTQPMATSDGRHALVYNGEIYNDIELRQELRDLGFGFSSGCDAETLLVALQAWGEQVIPRLRGMFAFAWHDQVRHQLVLARDPLGMKPLYYWLGSTSTGPELVFASEPTAILAHPGVPIRPNLPVISAYLSTMRTFLDDRTMFEGVRVLRPGEMICFDLRSGDLSLRAELLEPASTPDGCNIEEVVHDSTRRHLRADVPTCAMLSGGLDSTIIVSIARELNPELHTYGAGAPSEDRHDDYRAATLVAAELGVRHTSVPLTQDLFLRRWPEMISRLGVPLTTPNEVAINEVARRMRGDGFVVTLSGEGADELFAGYDRPLAAVREATLAGATPDPALLAHLELTHNSWLTTDVKPSVLHDRTWNKMDQDAGLLDVTQQAYARAIVQAQRVCASPTSAAIRATLEFHRRVNLPRLLARLDTAAMLESVEGRTPFADAAVMACAAGLSLDDCIHWGEGEVTTKAALRRAFAHAIPELALRRPKASFPLPFVEWMTPMVSTLRSSSLVADLFTTAAIEAVIRQPGELWRLSWPMLNLAIWGERWWGREKAQRPEQAPGAESSSAEIRISGGGARRPSHPGPAEPASSATE